MAFSNRHSKFNRRGGRFYQPLSQPGADSLPKPETSQVRIENVKSASELPVAGNKAQIENVEYVASFNWKDARDPIILVPGKPPRWEPPSTVQSLPEDRGKYYRDPNSARFPSFPIEPTIRAICTTVPGFDISEIDVFGCGNTIGSLLSFARDEERTFRIGVEYIDSTLFLVRKTNEPAELMKNVRGYGHSFPEAYTRWDQNVKGSASHQRIIKYDFAGLKCFVRSESDGYLPNLVDTLSGASNQLSDDNEETLDEHQLLSLALGLQEPSKSKSLVVRHAGEAIPQLALFDLKTRALKSKQYGVTVEAFLHRLWVNQIPNMILAYHTYGRFEPSDIHVVDVRGKVAEWETTNVTTLSKLGNLLHKLIDLAKQNGRTCFEIRRLGSGPLEIWSEAPHWCALPNNLKKDLGVSNPQDSLPGESRPAQEAEQDDQTDDDADYLRF